MWRLLLFDDKLESVWKRGHYCCCHQRAGLVAADGHACGAYITLAFLGGAISLLVREGGHLVYRDCCGTINDKPDGWKKRAPYAYTAEKAQGRQSFVAFVVVVCLFLFLWA